MLLDNHQTRLLQIRQHSGQISKWDRQFYQVLKLQTSAPVPRGTAAHYEIRNQGAMKKYVQMFADVNSILYLCSTEKRNLTAHAACDSNNPTGPAGLYRDKRTLRQVLMPVALT